MTDRELLERVAKAVVHSRWCAAGACHCESLGDEKAEAILQLLQGIDQTEIESAEGWWETSDGAKFGAAVLAKVKKALGV